MGETMVPVVLLEGLATDRRSYIAGDVFECQSKAEAASFIARGIAKPISEKDAVLSGLVITPPALPNVDDALIVKTPAPAPVVIDDDEGDPEQAAGELPNLPTAQSSAPATTAPRRPGRPRKGD